MPSSDASTSDEIDRSNSGSDSCYDSCDEQDVWLGLVADVTAMDLKAQDSSSEEPSTDTCGVCGNVMASYSLVPCTESSVCEDCVQYEECSGSLCQCPICTQAKAGLVLRIVVQPCSQRCAVKPS